IHGWGADGGLDALVFRITRPAIDVFSIERAALASLGMGVVALAGWILFRRWIWAAVAFLLGMGICPFVSERQLPGYLAPLAVIGAARTRRPSLWLLAGVLGSVTLFFTLDFGVFFLSASAVSAVALGLADRRPREGFSSLGLLVTGALAGALPFLAILAGVHA